MSEAHRFLKCVNDARRQVKVHCRQKLASNVVDAVALLRHLNTMRHASPPLRTHCSRNRKDPYFLSSSLALFVVSLSSLYRLFCSIRLCYPSFVSTLFLIVEFPSWNSDGNADGSIMCSKCTCGYQPLDQSVTLITIQTPMSEFLFLHCRLNLV
jgi:hypothetical protein